MLDTAINEDDMIVEWLEQADGSSLLVAKQPDQLNPRQQQAIDIAIASGVLEKDGDRYALTQRGWDEAHRAAAAN